MLKPRPNSGPALIFVKWTKTAPKATVLFSLLLLNLRTRPDQRKISKVSWVTKNSQRLRMSLKHLTLCSFVLRAPKSRTRNLERKRRSNTTRSRGKVESQGPRSWEATQLPIAETAKTWVTSPVSTVVRRVTTRINVVNPNRTMPTRKISSCLAYTELEWRDARSAGYSKFGFLWYTYIGLRVFSLTTYFQANNDYSYGLERWECLSTDWKKTLYRWSWIRWLSIDDSWLMDLDRWSCLRWLSVDNSGIENSW